MAAKEEGRAPLRAAFRNSVVWGVVWGTIGTVVSTLFRLRDGIPVGNAMLDGLGMGIRIGVAGAIAGAAFVAFIRVAYRGKRLAEISPLRFGIGGAVVAGLFVPGFLQTMSLLTGGGLVPWHLLADDFLLSTAFGGITAAGTMLLAQRGAVARPVTVESLLERMERETLGTGAAQEHDAARRRQLEKSPSRERP